MVIEIIQNSFLYYLNFEKAIKLIYTYVVHTHGKIW
jgi:hypothetical protein